MIDQRIKSDRCPGGVVFQVWIGEKFWRERLVTEPGSDLARLSEGDAEEALTLAEREGVVVTIRAYDGDSGDLMALGVLDPTDAR